MSMNEKIPTLGEKIANLIAESPFKNPLNFHKEIERRCGKDAIKQRRLYFVINYRGNRKHKETVLYQIASALGMEIYELVEGTTSEPPAQGPSHGVFPYGAIPNTKAAILRNLYHGLSFKPQMIQIKGLGTTVEENEEIEGFQCFKFVVLIRGEVDLVIKHKDDETERIALKLNEGYNFDSGNLHYFENKSKQFSRIMIIGHRTPV